MDMADLTAQAMLSGDDLLVNNHAAAYAGPKGYHDNIRKPFAAALPHLGCLEQVASATGIAREARRKMLWQDTFPSSQDSRILPHIHRA